MRKKIYHLRKATEADYDFVYQVKRAAYRRYVELYYGNWIEEHQREYFKKFIETYKEGLFVITVDGTDVGFYNGRLMEAEYEICNLCIVPEYQNRGIGTAVLRDIIGDNPERTIRLQYFKENPVGRLYKRLGFRLVGETSFHYQMLRK